MPAKISINRKKIADFCRKWSVKELAFFGSVLRDDFRPESDVDVLVSFLPQDVPDFFRLYEMERELSSILGGRRIDLVTRKFLSPRISRRVLSEAQVQYAA